MYSLVLKGVGNSFDLFHDLLNPVWLADNVVLMIVSYTCFLVLESTLTIPADILSHKFKLSVHVSECDVPKIGLLTSPLVARL